MTELKIAKKVAAGAAKIINSIHRNNVSVISSHGKDIKTKADQTAHIYIVNELSKTGIPVVSEEGDIDSFNININQWIIDPIDGTMNLSRGFEMSAVSIALWDKGAPILGVIQHIFSDQVFTSYKNKGAWLNDKNISVSNIKDKSEAILSTGFPSGGNFSRQSLHKFVIDIQQYKKLRLLGSAALMLSYVARGIFDVYYEKDIYIWDVAAGLALVSEAGGAYSLMPGSSVLQYDVKASNKFIFQKIQ